MDAYITLLWFVAGLVVGWLIEFFIDWRFWRTTLLSSELNQVAGANELATLRKRVQEYEARIHELEEQVEQASLAAASIEDDTYLDDLDDEAALDDTSSDEDASLLDDEVAVTNLSTSEQQLDTEADMDDDDLASGRAVGPTNITE